MEIDTPHGPARAHLTHAEAPRAALLLGHGAGGGVAAPDLVAVAGAAVEDGISVALIEQPYRVAGRRSAAPARQLDVAWEAVVAALFGRAGAAAASAADADGADAAGAGGADAAGAGGAGAAPFAGLPLISGGRSSGARVACRTAAATGAVGVLCLAFPLQPPTRAGKDEPPPSRLPELNAVPVPVLIVQGRRDRFGIPRSSAARGRTVVLVNGDHALRGDRAAVVGAARAWWTRLLA